MRRLVLTVLFCGSASAALWNWGGGSEVVTLLVCGGCILLLATIATAMTPRPEPQHWTDRDIRAYAFTDGIQIGLLIGLVIGTDGHIRTGRGVFGVVVASGILVLLCTPFSVWGRRAALTQQRDDARLAAGDVFD